MPSILDKFARVTEQLPCPVCGRGRYCLVSPDGRKAICTKQKSGLPRKSRKGNIIGWLHYVSPAKQVARKVSTPSVYLPPEKVRSYVNMVTTPREVGKMLKVHAHKLGVSIESLKCFRAGYDSEYAALVFPMYDAKRIPVGARMRRTDGRKFSLKGGREGVFLPNTFVPYRPVVVCEGPTDAAACFDTLTPNVIGRPNCSGGVSIILELLVKNPLTPVLILADNDEHGAGQDGARALAVNLPNPAIILYGPDDFRDYVTTSNLKAKAKRVIIDTLNEKDDTGFNVLFRNQAGQFFDFGRMIQ